MSSFKEMENDEFLKILPEMFEIEKQDVYNPQRRHFAKEIEEGGVHRG